MGATLMGFVAWALVLPVGLGASIPDIADLSAEESEMLAVLNRLAATDTDQVAQAINDISHSRHRVFDEPLRRILRHGQDTRLRRLAAETLARLDWPPSADELVYRIEALGTATYATEPEVRRAALAALGSFATPTAGKLLRTRREELAGEDLAVIARALKTMREPDALSRLADWIARSGELQPPHGVPTTWQRVRLARTVLSSPKAPGIPRALPLLFAVPDPRTTRALLFYVARHGSEESLALVLGHLDSQPLPEDLSFLAHLLTAGDRPRIRQQAARVLGSHQTPQAITTLVTQLDQERDKGVLKEIAASLRRQETAPLAAGLAEPIRRLQGYALQLAVFLLRERDGDEVLWPQVLAHARSPDPAVLEKLRATDAELRRRVLLPKLDRKVFDDLSLAEQQATLATLVGITDDRIARALLAHLTPSQPGELFRASAPVLADQKDELVVPHLRKLLADKELQARQEVYRLLLSRPSVDADKLLAKALARERQPELRLFLLQAAAGDPAPALLAQVAQQLAELEEVRLLEAALVALAGVEDPTLGPAYTAIIRRHPSAPVGDAAFAHLLALPAPVPVVQLRELVADPELAQTMRLRAITGLGEHGSNEDITQLTALTENASSEVRVAARNALHAISPAEYPLWDDWGRYPLVGAAAGAGAMLFWFPTRAAGGKEPAREILLGVGGALLGGGTAFLLTMPEGHDVSLGEAGYFATMATWSTLGGFALSRVSGFGQEYGSEANLWAAMAFEAAGVAVGATTMKLAHFTPEDVLLTNLVAASWGMGFLGVVQVSGLGEGSSGEGDIGDIFALGGLVGSIPLYALSSRIKLDGNGIFGLGVSAGTGAFLGAFAPPAFDCETDVADVVGGILLGQALGLSTGLVLNAVTPFDYETAAWAGVGLATGAMAGAGLGMSEPALHGQATYGMLEGGSVLGAGLLGFLGPRLAWGQGDIALVTMMAAAGGVVGGYLPTRALEAMDVPKIPDHSSPEGLVGGLLLGSTLGFYAGLTTSQFVEHTPGEIAMTSVAMTALGFGVGGVALMVPSVDNQLFSPLLAAGTAAGAIGMSFLAPQARYEAGDIVLGASTATLGAALGAMTPIYWTADNRPLPDPQQLGADMVGMTSGLLAAFAISQWVDIPWQRALKIDFTALGGLALGAGLGLVSPDIDARLTVALMQAGAVAGYGVAFFSERQSTYDVDAKFHLVLGGLVGAWHGWTIPFLWREAKKDGEPFDEVAGGVLLGSALGALTTRLLFWRGTYELWDVGEIALFDLAGSALGGGLAFMLAGEDRRLRFSLLTGSGLLLFGLGEWLAPYTTYQEEDLWLISAMAANGALAGLGAAYWPTTVQAPDPTAIVGGALVGAGSATLVGMGLSQVRPHELEDIAEMAVVSGVGAVGGLGLAAAHQEVSVGGLVRGASIGGLGGMALGLAVAPYTQYTRQDWATLATTSVVGAFCGSLASWATRGDRVEVEELLGGGGMGASVGWLGASAASQFVDLPYGATLEGGIFATAAALAAGGLARMNLPRDHQAQAGMLLGSTLAGYGVGLTTGHFTELSFADWLWVSSAIGLGAWHGAWAPASFGRKSDRASQGGVMLGAGSGALLGYGLSQAIELDSLHNLEILSSTAVGAMIGGGFGLLVAADPQKQAWAVELGSLAGLGLGAGLGHLTTYEEAIPLLVASAAWGAWQGGWLGGLVEPPGVSVEHRVGGGVLLGLGSGLALGMAASQVVSLETDEVVEGSFYLGAGNMVGAGIGMLTGAGKDATLGLLQGAGIAALMAGLVASPYTEIEGSDFGLIAYTTAVAASHGALLAGYAVDSGYELPAQSAGGGALLGAGVGIGAGILAAQWLQIDALDLVELGMLTAIGDTMASGLAMLADLEGRGFFALLQGGGLVLTAAGLAVSEMTDFDTGDRLLIAYGAVLGAGLGSWTPFYWAPEGKLAPGDSDDPWAGALVGMGIGALGAGVAGQILDYSDPDVGEIMLGSTLSAVAGAGLGMVLSGDTRVVGGVIQSVSLAGVGLTAAFAKDTEYSLGDAALGTVAGLYGVYQGTGLALLADAKDREVAGAILLGGAAGALAGMYLGPYLQLNGTDILMLASGSAWGVWLGIWTTAAIEELTDPEIGVLEMGVGTTALLTDLALTLTAFGISELVDLDPLRFAWISVGGGAGLLLGVTVSQLAANTYAQGLLWGTVAGLAAGTIITQFVDLPGMGQAAEDEERPAESTETPMHAQGMLPEIESWLPAVQVMPADGERRLAQQVLFTVTGTFF